MVPERPRLCSALIEMAAAVDNPQLATWAMRRAGECVTTGALRRASTLTCFRNLVELNTQQLQRHILPPMDILIRAALHGDLHTLKSLDNERHIRERGCGPWLRLALTATQRGGTDNMAVLAWLCELMRHPRLSSDCLWAPAARGDMEMLTWLMNKGARMRVLSLPTTSSHTHNVSHTNIGGVSHVTTPGSIRRDLDQLLGHAPPLEYLQYVWTNGMSRAHATAPNSVPADVAAQRGRGDLVRWLVLDQGVVVHNFGDLVDRAVSSSSVDCLQAALNLCPPDWKQRCADHMRYYSAVFVHRRADCSPTIHSVSMARHLIEHYGASPTEGDLEFAISYGELELAKVILPHIRTLPPHGGGSGDIPVILLERERPISRRPHDDGHRRVAMLEWLVAHGFTFPAIRIGQCVSWDVWPVLEWAVKHGVPVQPWADFTDQGWIANVLDYQRTHGAVPRVRETVSGKLIWEDPRCD